MDCGKAPLGIFHVFILITLAPRQKDGVKFIAKQQVVNHVSVKRSKPACNINAKPNPEQSKVKCVALSEAAKLERLLLSRVSQMC